MSLTDAEFELSGARYTIRPLGAMAGWRLLEQIRFQVGGVLNASDISTVLSVDAEDTAAVTSMIAQVVLKLEPEFVQATMATLFRNVRFQNNQAISGQTLQGSEDMAFADAGDPYEVLVRCLAVNFGGSALRLVSKLGGGGPSTGQSGQSA